MLNQSSINKIIKFQTETLPKSEIYNYIKSTIVNNHIISTGEFELLGEVTKDTISFDPEPYVPKEIVYMPLIDMVTYTDYQNEEDSFRTPQESFYSLLAANGMHFVNPIPYPKDNGIIDFDSVVNKWQSYKDKLIKGKLIILNKIK